MSRLFCPEESSLYDIDSGQKFRVEVVDSFDENSVSNTEAIIPRRISKGVVQDVNDRLYFEVKIPAVKFFSLGDQQVKSFCYLGSAKYRSIEDGDELRNISQKFGVKTYQWSSTSRSDYLVKTYQNDLMFLSVSTFESLESGASGSFVVTDYQFQSAHMNADLDLSNKMSMSSFVGRYGRSSREYELLCLNSNRELTYLVVELSNDEEERIVGIQDITTAELKQLSPVEKLASMFFICNGTVYMIYSLFDYIKRGFPSRTIKVEYNGKTANIIIENLNTYTNVDNLSPGDADQTVVFGKDGKLTLAFDTYGLEPRSFSERDVKELIGYNEEFDILVIDYQGNLLFLNENLEIRHEEEGPFSTKPFEEA